MDIQKTSIQQSALGWVRKAIDEHLSEIRTNLNRYQDDYDDSLIEEMKEQLIVINGVLTMVEQFGAAMLTEEMVSLCDFLVSEEKDKKDPVLEVLLRSVLQLPDYIERIQSGLTDLPLVILPLLNDIRAVQDKDLFSEKLLFLPKISKDIESDLENITSNDVKRAQIYAKKIRPVYLFSILNLIKENKTEEQYLRLKTVASVMEERALSDELTQFWIIFAALIESTSSSKLELSVSIKKLLGRVDAVLRSLIKQGEAGYIKKRPADLIKNLLYYVAQPECNGEKALAVKTAYNLDHYLPSENERKQIISTINGPNKALLETVGESVKNDIETVKSTLEVYVNGDLSAIERLAKVPEELHIISDTLGMVGMGSQREIIESKRAIIQSILDKEHEPNEEELLLIAHDLLLVEDGLDNINKIQTAQVDGDEPTESDFEFDNVLKAVVTATLDDFQKIQTTILDYIKDNSKTENLSLCVSLLNESKGAMDILGESKVSAIMSDMSEHLEHADKLFLSPNRLDLFADVIISIEFFLEALASRRDDKEVIAELTEIKLKRLQKQISEDASHQETEAQELEPAEALDKVVESISQDLDEIHDALETASEEQSEEESSLYPKLSHVVATKIQDDLEILVEGSDPDILEIYIEEAEEESANIKNNFKLWKRDLDNEVLLTTIRRSFHTIKGSGRLVGALSIGEFAWDFEELLNRLLAKTINNSPDIVQCLAYSVSVLPELVEQIKSGAEPTYNALYLRGLAQTLSTYDAAETLLEIDRENAHKQSTDENSSIDESSSELQESIDDESIESSEDFSNELESVKDDLESESEPELLMLEPEVPADDSLDIEISIDEELEKEVVDDNTSRGLEEERVEIVDEDEDIVEITMDSPSIETIEDDSISHIDEDSVQLLNTNEQDSTEVIGIDETEILLTDPTELVEIEPTNIILEDDTQDVVGEAPPDPFVETSSVSEPVTEQEGSIAPEIELVQPKKEPEKTKTLDDNQPLIDSELFAIYQQEVQNHINEIFTFLDTLSIDSTFDPTPIYRSLHTINGASKTARIMSIGDFAKAMEKPLRDIEDEDRVSFDHETHQLYIQGVTQLSLMVDELEGSSEEPEYSQELLNEFKQLQLKPINQKTDNESETSEQTIAINEEIEEEQDPELIEIFLEEANEILNDSDNALYKWKNEIINNKETDSINTIMKMQRYLHTLKGGARMANFNQIGDLSHEMESLFIDVLDNHIDVNIELMDVLNDCFDLLANMVASAEHKKAMPSNEQALTNLINIRQGNDVSPIFETKDVESSVDQEIPVEDEKEEILETQTTSQAEKVIDSSNVDDFVAEDMAKSKDIIKVRSDLLDNLVSSAGEVSIYRSRMQQQVSSVNNNLGELDQTILRLKRQLRDLEAETDAQIRYSHKDNDEDEASYDPLEMDRYTKMQELSKSLAESVEDLSSLKLLMGEQLKGSETLLLQQSRINGDLQDGLIRSRMVRFSGLTSRLRRIVRQVSGDLAKKIDLVVVGEHHEIDNKVLDRMLSPLEHLLRNAIAHGIETPLERVNKGKKDTGTITIEIKRIGGDIVISVADDGSGIDKDKVRRRALQLGIIEDLSKVQDQDLIQLILEPGFSTVDNVTQVSGRGVGMDVVDNEVKQLGGSLSINSTWGEGTTFVAKLPFTLSVNQAILVEIGEESYAIPLNNVEGISRLDGAQLIDLYQQDSPTVSYGDNQYELYYLAPLLEINKQFKSNNIDEKQPIILVRAGEIRLAIHVDKIVGNREIVVKSLGKQLSHVKSLSGASILGDGRIVFILDVSGLVKHGINTQVEYVSNEDHAKEAEIVELPKVMVVDDSITMRRVAQKLLGRNNFDVITAKDGIDALSQLGEVMPDVMLLDIEMPRMDGFELATHMKKDDGLNKIPIIMVTSRTGDKHRKHAKDIGVERYMGKPYQEAELLGNINELLEAV